VLCLSSILSSLVLGSSGSHPTRRQNSGPGRWAMADPAQNNISVENKMILVCMGNSNGREGLSSSVTSEFVVSSKKYHGFCF
jgi:hypothetical protein